MSEHDRGSSGIEGFGVRLRRRRTRALLTQEMLGELAHVNPRTIRDIETGRTRRPRASTMRLLWDALPSEPDDGPHTIEPLPHELPPDTRGFTGRAAELARLDRLLGPSDSESTTVIAAIAGTAGVGKTALAIHWAHRVANEFRDGQLYVNLRGYDDTPPVQPAEALAAFIRALGAVDAEIPERLDERINRYRSLVAGRRMLILLDNARCADQVCDLLPGSSSSVVLVTSRDSLGGLTVRHGADRMTLDPMPLEDARELLRTHIGRRVDTEPASAEVLAGQCANLPLALRIAAQLATARPRLTLSDLTTGLAGEEERLDALDIGDRHNSVEVVFSWSYQHLAKPAACLFRLLGANPGHDVDAHACAAIADVDVRNARQLLAVLARAHLIQETSLGRHSMHDLLRAYAAKLAGQVPEADLRSALTRLFDYSTHAAATAMDLVVPNERSRRPPLPTHSRLLPPFQHRDAALAWLDTERANLIAIADYAADHGWPELPGHLSTILYRYLDIRALHDDAKILHGAALRTAGPSTLGRAMANYGVVLWRGGQYLDAKKHYQQTLPLLQGAGERFFEATVHGNLGVVCWRLGHDDEALEHYQHAAALYHELDEPASEGGVLNNLAVLYQRLGRLNEAYNNQERAIQLVQQSGDLNDETSVWNDFATTCRLLGKHAQALDYHQRALTLLRKLGDRRQEIVTLNDLGATLNVTGSPTSAIAHHRQALQHAEELNDCFEQARAHNGIAHAHQCIGNQTLARTHWLSALALHTKLKTPEAKKIAHALQLIDSSPN